MVFEFYEYIVQLFGLFTDGVNEYGSVSQSLAVYLSYLLVIGMIYMFLKLIFPNVSKFRNIVFVLIVIVLTILFLFTALQLPQLFIMYFESISNIGNVQTSALMGGV